MIKELIRPGHRCCGSVMFIPGARIRSFSTSDPGSKIFPDQDLHQTQAKNLFLSSLNQDPDPESGTWFFTHPGSRAQKGTGSRIRICNTAGHSEGIWSVFKSNLLRLRTYVPLYKANDLEMNKFKQKSTFSGNYHTAGFFHRKERIRR